MDIPIERFMDMAESATLMENSLELLDESIYENYEPAEHGHGIFPDLEAHSSKTIIYELTSKHVITNLTNFFDLVCYKKGLKNAFIFLEEQNEEIIMEIFKDFLKIENRSFIINNLIKSDSIVEISWTFEIEHKINESDYF